jgi:uncharacterized protein with HEPN domain
MSRDDATLVDIESAPRLIIEFTQGMDEPAFLRDVKTQSAVLHQLMVIGEAVKRLTPQFHDAHPAVPWRLVARMRDRLIHGYDSVDLSQVGRTVQGDVPRLRSQIRPLLPREES